MISTADWFARGTRLIDAACGLNWTSCSFRVSIAFRFSDQCSSSGSGAVKYSGSYALSSCAMRR